MRSHAAFSTGLPSTAGDSHRKLTRSCTPQFSIRWAVHDSIADMLARTVATWHIKKTYRHIGRERNQVLDELEHVWWLAYTEYTAGQLNWSICIECLEVRSTAIDTCGFQLPRPENCVLLTFLSNKEGRKTSDNQCNVQYSGSCAYSVLYGLKLKVVFQWRDTMYLYWKYKRGICNIFFLYKGQPYNGVNL